MNSEFGFLFNSMTSCTFHKLPQSGDVDISWITKQLWLPPFLFYLYVCTGTRWTCKLPMKRPQLARTILLWYISANYCITHALTFKIFKSSVIVEIFFMGTTLLVILDQTIRFFFKLLQLLHSPESKAGKTVTLLKIRFWLLDHFKWGVRQTRPIILHQQCLKRLDRTSPHPS